MAVFSYGVASVRGRGERKNTRRCDGGNGIAKEIKGIANIAYGGNILLTSYRPIARGKRAPCTAPPLGNIATGSLTVPSREVASDVGEAADAATRTKISSPAASIALCFAEMGLREKEGNAAPTPRGGGSVLTDVRGISKIGAKTAISKIGAKTIGEVEIAFF